MKILEQLFSVNNSNDKKHKIITIVGIKIKIKRKPKWNEILLPKFIDLDKKLASNISTIRACQIHPKTFGEYKNCNIGKDVVLILGGPTIKFFEPFENAIYVTVNNCCKYDKVKFDYLFLQELHIDKIKNEIANNYDYNNCIKFYGIIPDNRLKQIYPIIKRIPQSHVICSNIRRYYLDDIFAYQYAYDLTTEALGDFGGTAFSAMQFILWTNPKRIFLVGADCTDKGNAFYNSTIKMNNQCQIESWEKLKKFIDDIYPDIEVISINPIGLKGLFTDIYTENYVYNEEKQKD